MRFGKISLAAIAAASLVSAPVVALAAPASKLGSASTAKRVGPAKKSENKMGGGSGLYIAIGAAAAIILGIVLLSDDDKPTSP